MGRLASETIPPAERIATLRRRCLDRKCAGALSGAVAKAASLRASESVASWQVRVGLRVRDTLAAVRWDLDELELLIGRAAAPANSEADIQAACDYLSRLPAPGGQTGHCEPDVGRVFELGIDALRGESVRLRDASDGDKSDAYESFALALDGLSALAVSGAAAAEAAMPDATDARRAELAEIAASCRRVAHDPPATFRDALQLLWLAEFGVMHGDQVGLVVPGHIDRTCRSYYEADLAAGRITRDEALVLIECLYLLLNEHVPDGLAMSIMVGGRDPDGRDATCDLSYLCLEALRRTRLIYPTVGVCWHEGTPIDLVELAVELIAEGITTPALFGDETIQSGLKALGLPDEQACCYINSTCVEITPSGASNVWVASPYFNCCGLLLEEIAAQADADRPAGTLQAFVSAYHRRFAEQIAKAVAQQNALRDRRRQFGRKPLQSVFTRDCIARGRDIDDGGAAVNWVECSFVGLANLADSLAVIEQEVFATGSLTFAELRALLESDFAEAEATRLRLLNGYPKYGNAQPEVDHYVGDMAAFVRSECAKHRMRPDDSALVPGAFCWVMHEKLGGETGATPDGRKAGTAFADGCGPAQGRESNGPTAAILSTTSWDHSPMIGGLACNMKFSKSLLAGADARAKLRDLVLTFGRRGGFEIQFNVLDADVLRKARQNPEAYRDLAVRIGGYVDYFTRLSPQMQDEVILRTEFAAL